LCDDLEIVTEENEITNLVNACGISRSKFLNHKENRLTAPTIEGKEVTFEKAVEEAVNIIDRSQRLLIYGLSSTECGAIGKAIELAEICGGVIDNTSSVCHGPTILALQQSGESKTTLGMVKNRADLVIFWGSNPSQSHLRHLARYSVTPKGLYVPDGRKGRHVVSVDVRETTMSRISDQFIKVSPGGDYELLLALRASLRGAEIPEEVSGVPREEIEKLTMKMKNSKMGIIFFGLGLTQTEGRHMNIDAAVGLVAELNHHTKFLLTPMRGHFNVAGANTVTTWQTGYPYAVDFSRGYPRYNPGEYSAIDLLTEKEADAALIIASDPVATFPIEAAMHLAKIPVITLDQKVTPTTMLSNVVIPVATAGIESEGTAYRMDGIPLRLSKIIEAENGFFPDSEIITRIIEGVKKTGGIQ
jgi:formylmethanofuran dehydrogenase subunit B